MQRQNILIIDDAPENLEILSAALSAECEVLCALSGSPIGLADERYGYQKLGVR
jgi:CheY-like chemotaxis protein